MLIWLYSFLIFMGMLIGCIILRFSLEFILYKIVDIVDYINYKWNFNWEVFWISSLCLIGSTISIYAIHSALLRVLK